MRGHVKCANHLLIISTNFYYKQNISGLVFSPSLISSPSVLKQLNGSSSLKQVINTYFLIDALLDLTLSNYRVLIKRVSSL